MAVALPAFWYFPPLFWVFHRYRRVDRLNRGFRRTQLLSAAGFSLGHGTNDAQKTMGVILALLIATHHLPADAGVPWWVKIAALTAIAAGTAFGGWRIVHTLGARIPKLQPGGGVSREAARAATPVFPARARPPVSPPPHITRALG